jgi:hypothetical protein
LNGKVGLLLLDEGKGDLNRFLENWGAQNLYWTSDQWFGAVRLISYLAPAPSLSFKRVTANARAGGNIVLESYQTLTHGRDLLIQLKWRATEKIDQPLKVFAHLYLGDLLVAQRDAQPLNELRPTTTWQKGDLIVDQFVLRAPQAGLHRVQVGLYDLGTQERLLWNAERDVLILDGLFDLK